jgi:anaerobic selenocysteine-containing dehydrogenase
VSAESGTRVVKSICSMCHNSCGIDVEVKDGKVVRVTPMKEHPFNRLCVKAQGIPQWLYSDERILSPLRKIDGNWQKVSWDEAFAFISDKLTNIKENYGAKALVIHLGTPFIGTELSRVASRFCSLYGTPNHTSSTSLCFAAKGIGHGLLFSNRMSTLCPSYENTRCIVVWGFNPQQSNVHQAAEISLAKRRGARLIVVDPRVIPMAKKADVYAQVKPGTDLALALGLLNVVIAEGLYDEAFVRDFTIGFDQLREHIKGYSPEVVEQITWVPAETIRKFARMYATNKPAAIAQGVSLDHCTNGVQTSRAISILTAITGNLDVQGGNIYISPLKQASLRIKGTVTASDTIGARFPIFGRFTGETTAMPVPDAILNEDPYPVKALIVQASNPLLTWPNTNKVKQAFSKLDLLVVADLFMTETAKLADVFLPAASFLERKTLKSYGPDGLPLVLMTDKVIEPLGDCLEDWRIWAELGKRMGYTDYFPWQSAEELFAHLLEPSGITVSQLKQNPGGLLYSEPSQQQKYKNEGLNTPSRKVEIFSQTMEKYGYDPLPAFTETESPVSQAYLADKDSFILTSGPRVSAFTHSRYRNIARLRRLVPEPLVEINADSAKNLGIGSGDEVIVTSPRGSIKLRAKLTEDIHPKLTSIQHGWNEANANLLTSEAGDPISDYPSFKSIPCRVVKV